MWLREVQLFDDISPNLFSSSSGKGNDRDIWEVGT